MVARMVRDHKVVGSNPVASTKKAGEQRLACLFELQRGKSGIRGEASKPGLRRSEETTDDTTALELGCRPCVSAQGTNPVASTKKREGFLPFSFFCDVVNKRRNSRGGGVLREQNGLRRETGCRDKKSRKLNGAVHRSPGARPLKARSPVASFLVGRPRNASRSARQDAVSPRHTDSG